MIKREELTNPASCMSRAKDDEMTFVLLGRDAAAPAAIHAWVTERIRCGKNTPGDNQIVEALECAIRMDQQRLAGAAALQCGPIKLDTNRAGHIFIDQDDKESPFSTRVILTPEQAMEVSQFIAKHYAASSPEPNRNSEVLRSLADYCARNPEQRFWQALRNWSGYGVVFVADFMAETPHHTRPLDTFSWESRRRELPAPPVRQRRRLER